VATGGGEPVVDERRERGTEDMNAHGWELPDEPLVSVLMSVRNGGELLAAAVHSILEQSYANLEFIIVDDGSSDDTAATIRSIADDRVTLLVQEKNQGIARSLNAAARVASGELLARQDADDLSELTRIEAQVRRFQEAPELCLLGTQATLIDPRGARLGETALPHQAPLRSAPLENPLVHGSVMIRREAFALSGGYDPRFSFAEDYELWLRLGRIGGVENLPEPLYAYRIHEGQFTSRNHELRLAHTALAAVLTSQGRPASASTLHMVMTLPRRFPS